MAEKDYYELLGVSKDATEQEIKTAYKKLARQYHPDLNQGNEEAANKFKQINEANEVLSNPQKRKQYDMGGMSGMGGGGFGGFGDFGGGGMGDIFSDLFSNVFSAFSGGGNARQNQTPDPIVVGVNLSFIDALRGVKKVLPITKMDTCPTCSGSGAKNGGSSTTCPKCGGSGRIQVRQQTPLGMSIATRACDKCGGKGRYVEDPCNKCFGTGIVKTSTTVEVDIPKGVMSGQMFTVRGGGNASSYPGVPKGDLVIKVSVEPHKYIKRQNNDLYMDLPIPLSVALLGGKVEIPTIDGGYVYDIPDGTTNGKVFKIRGKGVPTRFSAGDLYVKVLVDIPKLSSKAKTAIDEFSKLVDKNDYKTVKQFNSDMDELLSGKVDK